MSAFEAQLECLLVQFVYKFFVNNHQIWVVNSTDQVDLIEGQVLLDELTLHQYFGFITLDIEYVPEVASYEMFRVESKIEIGQVLDEHLNCMLLSILDNLDITRQSLLNDYFLKLRRKWSNLFLGTV